MDSHTEGETCPRGTLTHLYGTFLLTFLWPVILVCLVHSPYLGLLGGSVDKESTCNGETWVPSLGWEDPLEEGMATHCSVLAGESAWAEEPGGLPSVGSQSQPRLSD